VVIDGLVANGVMASRKVAVTMASSRNTKPFQIVLSKW
jgi:hypothetical protein